MIEAGASAGVCLGFRTDAEELIVPFRLGPGSSQDFYSFELYTDGVLAGSTAGLLSKTPSGALQFSLPEGSKDLLLCLPNLERTFLSGAKLKGASFAVPLPGKKRLLCLGDSITQGYLAHTHSSCYASRLARLLDAELLNQGVGAECFRAETLDSGLPFRPDLVTIAFGTNDWSTRTPDVFALEAEKYLEEAARLFAGSRIAVITPLFRTDEGRHSSFPDWPLAKARKTLEEIVSRTPGLTLIPGETLLPKDASLLEDHVHPNDKGFTVLADALYAALSDLC